MDDMFQSMVRSPVGKVFAGALASYPIGLLSLRLESHYLAIVTLGFSEIIRLFAHNEQWLTGGAEGLMGIPRPFIGLGVHPGAIAYLLLLLGLNLLDLPQSTCQMCSGLAAWPG